MYAHAADAVGARGVWSNRVAAWIFGCALIVHGVAHLLPAMTAAYPGAPLTVVVVTVLAWSVATLGLLGAGLGLLGVRSFRDRWKGLAVTGAIASLVLLVMVGEAVMALPGALVDTGLLAWLLRRSERSIWRART